MEYLDMLDYPLILDEFGRTMDETHRIKAYDLIEELSKKYFSQIFLVSHFESMYNRFQDVDIVVLNDENISLESTNNVLKIN
jgi:ABC-type Mn2+/Zn2+ transport system ATPase subunit